MNPQTVVLLFSAADAPLSTTPQLPGPAAPVRYVPTQDELSTLLRAGGFYNIQVAKLSAAPYLRHEGIGLRELLLEAKKLDASPFDLRQTVLYKGPLKEVTDDFGNVLRRGEKTAITTPAVEAIRSGAMAEAFLIFAPGAD